MEPAATSDVVLRVHSAIAGRVTAVVIGLAFVGGAYLPPGHCHPSTDSHTAVVHRHASPHVLRHIARPTLADDDGQIIWNDGSYLAGRFTQAGVDHRVGLPAVHPAQFEVPSSAETAFLPPPSGRVHDPPWRTSGSRAPPVSLSI